MISSPRGWPPRIVAATLAAWLSACAAPKPAAEAPAPKVAETVPRLFAPALSTFHHNRRELEALAIRIRQFPKLTGLQPDNINKFWREQSLQDREKWRDTLVPGSIVTYAAVLDSAGITHDDYVALSSEMQKLGIRWIDQYECGAPRTCIRFMITTTGLTLVRGWRVGLVSMDMPTSEKTDLASLPSKATEAGGPVLSPLDDGWYLQLEN